RLAPTNLRMRSETMSYKHTAEKLADYRRQIGELRQKMRDVQAAVEPEPVKDYTFQRAGGESVRLSELFGDKADLFVIHNMGQSCPYCTLWADGFNGAYAHLSNRAAFVVSSPDTPEKQRKFAESRHWTFPMVSHEGTTFAEDVGYRQDGGWMPGVSVFRRQNGGIVRVSDAPFSPGDDFGSVWHFFDLIRFWQGQKFQKPPPTGPLALFTLYTLITHPQGVGFTSLPYRTTHHSSSLHTSQGWQGPFCWGCVR